MLRITPALGPIIYTGTATMPRDDDDDYDDRPRKKPPRDEDAPRPKQRPAPRRDDDDDDDPDDRPRRRPAPRDEDEDEPRRRRRDEDSDDEPRAKRRDRRDDDEEDYDDDRPRRKRRGVEKIIPYHNGMALASYSCSFGAVIAILASAAITVITAPRSSRGLFLALDIGGGGGLGLLAIVFGVLGMIKVKRTPEAGGTMHAIIGMVLGIAAGIGVVVALFLMRSFFIDLGN